MTAPDPLAGAATGEARPAPQPAGSRVIEGARLFRWLGLIGFGGPAAPIALMEDGVVRRRRWLDRERVLDLLGATDRIPGANSTALAIHVGYVRAGFPGLVVAGSCFILPGRLIVLALARASGRFSRLPQLEWLLYGLKPVIVVIVIQAVWRLGRIALATPMTAGLAIAVAGLSLRGVNEVLLLFGATLAANAIRWWIPRRTAASLGILGTALLSAAPGSLSTVGLAAGTSAPPAVNLVTLLLTFRKVGSIPFGSGSVLLAFRRPDLVVRTGRLSDRQRLDAVASSQIIPGRS